jgi:cellulose synthase/poly-beta-1,6-N-acetylglucosamine synthase-like glycosyltransferase
LVDCFADPTVDAVCGNVQVGNVHSILTAFQNVEYVTSQNYDRRAFDHLNCISVVPGATGAWRRDKVLSIGGYSGDTLTEDADLTLGLLSSGGRVVYSPLANSITEAPETVRTLFRQRFRWSFGTLQCLWKYRAQGGRGSLGWVALPNMFLFQVLFPLLSPLGDVILLLCLLRRDFNAVAAGYLAFLAMDLIGSTIALRLDRRHLREIWVVFIQRFYYRQFMYIVTIAAVLAGLGGRRHAWNKLHRTGSVSHRPVGPRQRHRAGEPVLASVL